MVEIKAEPFAFPLRRDAIALIVIDMQRDFAEPGGFGASLGNDVSRITRIVPEVKRLIEGFRAADCRSSTRWSAIGPTYRICARQAKSWQSGAADRR